MFKKAQCWCFVHCDEKEPGIKIIVEEAANLKLHEWASNPSPFCEDQDESVLEKRTGLKELL